MYTSAPPELLSVLLGTSAAVGVFDTDLRLRWASDAYLALLPPAPNPIGLAMGELAQRDQNLPFFKALEATNSDGRRRTARNDSGDFGRVFDNVVSRVGQYTVVEVTDNTAQVRAEELQRLAWSTQEAVIDHMQEVVVMIDFQQHTVLTNEACVAAFGDFTWLREFVSTGRPFEELEVQFPVEDPEGRLAEAFEIGARVMATGVAFHGVLELPTLKGVRTFQVVSTSGSTRAKYEV